MKKSQFAQTLLGDVLSSKDSDGIYNKEKLALLIDCFNAKSLKINPLMSHSSQVFLLEQKSDNQKFILKIRRLEKSLDNKKLKIEALVSKILSKSIVTSKPVIYGISKNYELSVYDYLPGEMADKRILKTTDILNIWELTLRVQDILLNSSHLLNLKINTGAELSEKVNRYTSRMLKKDLSECFLKTIKQHLETETVKNSYTVFSDRSPANWVLTEKQIIPIDFDVLLIEPLLSDFVQFIDDYRLQSEFNRNDLIDKCLTFLRENDYSFSREEFHWHAIYRNLIQGAVFYQKNKLISEFHYKAALKSADYLKSDIAKQEIKKILS